MNLHAPLPVPQQNLQLGLLETALEKVLEEVKALSAGITRLSRRRPLEAAEKKKVKK